MSESFSSDSSSFSDVSIATDDSNESFDEVAGCYDCEPEYTAEELKNIKEIIEKHSSSEDELEFELIIILDGCV